MKKIVIFGAGGHSKVVYEIAIDLGYRVLDFVDNRVGKEIFSYRAISMVEFLKKYKSSKEIEVFVAIGDNRVRAKVYRELKEFGFNFATLISESAKISKSAKVEEASVVMPKVIVNAEAKIGIGSILNTGSIIEHDCKIGEFTHISIQSALAGAVRVGEFSYLGAGSVVIQGVNIGVEVQVGAGGVVVSNISDFKRVVGVPAKREI